MRALGLSLALAGCASAAPLVEGETLDVLSPAQLEQAFEGRAACVVHPEDGACESIIYTEAWSANTRSARDISVTDLEKFVDEPLTQFVRQLPMFTAHGELFRRLEVQRRAGGFKYVKEVIVDDYSIDRATNRICSRVPLSERFESSTFYFSNSPSSDLATDTRMDANLERELRAFLRAVIADPDFRAGAEARARENDQLEIFERVFGMLEGRLDLCASYAGVVQQGRIELTTMNIFVGGHADPSLDRVIRPYPRDAEVPLRGN
jgi:hypothetical protein